MHGSFRERLLRAGSIGFAAVPFAFALIRAFGTGGRDLRYLWVALAAFCGAAGVMVFVRPRGALKMAIVLSAGAFVVATMFAVSAALLLGTRLGPGSLVVGAAFACCFAAGCLLYSMRMST